jgi:peroxiredoxin
MKTFKHLFIGASLLLLASCAQTPKNAFVLKGNLTNYPGDTLYMMYQDSTEQRVVDTIIVKDGKFSVSGMINKPTSATLLDGKNASKKDMYDMQMVNIYLEPGAKMDFSAEWFEGDSKELKTPYALTGSKTNDEYQEFNKSMTAAGQEHYTDTLKAFIARYPDSYISVSQLSMFGSMLPTSTYDSLSNMLGEKAKSYSEYQDITNELTKLHSIEVGKPAPDFTRTDLNGKTFKLSDYRGKTVILDFWATWCVPCRASMPHMKEIYAKYKKDGLVVICIADDDKNEDQWKEAIKKDGTDAFIHVLRGFVMHDDGSMDKTNDLDDFYAVSSIPSRFIVDKDGNLAAVKAEDAEIDAKLKEIYGK